MAYLRQPGTDDGRADQAVFFQIDALAENAAHDTEPHERVRVRLVKRRQELFFFGFPHRIVLPEDFRLFRNVHQAVYIVEKGVRGKEDHVISLSGGDKILDIGGDLPILLLTAPLVPARDVVGDDHFALARLECGPGVNSVIVRIG